MFKKTVCILCMVAATGFLVSTNGFCEDNAFSDGFKRGVGEELGRVVTRAIIDAARSNNPIRSSCALSLVKPLSPLYNRRGNGSIKFVTLEGAAVENNSITPSNGFYLMAFLTNQQSYSGGGNSWSRVIDDEI